MPIAAAVAADSEFLDGIFFGDPGVRKIRRRLPPEVAYHPVYGFKKSGVGARLDRTAGCSDRRRHGELESPAQFLHVARERSMRAYLPYLLFLLVLIGVRSSAHADTLVLENGDEISGEIIEWAADHVVIEHPQLGTMRLELGQLKLDTGTPPKPGLFGTRFLRGWIRRIDFGLNGEQDDSPSSTLTFGSKLAYEDSWARWRISGRYFYNLDDDGDNDNNAIVDLRRDWLDPESRWFAALAGRYQFDQFKDWKHRFTVLGGPGFHLVDTEKHGLDLMAGPAFTREFGTSKANEAEAVLVLSYDWKISERQSFDFANQYFFQVSPNAGDWRNFTTLGWSLRITERPALSLNLVLQNEYESEPEPGDPKNDLKYALTLGMDF